MGDDDEHVVVPYMLQERHPTFIITIINIIIIHRITIILPEAASSVCVTPSSKWEWKFQDLLRYMGIIQLMMQPSSLSSTQYHYC